MHATALRAIAACVAAGVGAEGYAAQEEWGDDGSGSAVGGNQTRDDVITRCTKDWICRISVLGCFVLAVGVCICACLKWQARRKRRGGFGRTQSQTSTTSVGTLLPPTNSKAAHAIQNYLPFQELWPGPQEWKKMSLQQRERVSAGVVNATSTVLYGERAPANAALLNDWVRSQHGIYMDDLESVRCNLDDLLCHLDPTQLHSSPLFGAPWPNHKRWRRLGSRDKAAIYAEFIQDKLTNRRQIKRYAKWVRERGYLLSRVEIAHDEAKKTIARISRNLPVAYSDFKLDEAPELADISVSVANLVDSEDEEGALLDCPRPHAEPAAIDQTPAERDIPELSITRASLRTPLGGDHVSREDSFSVFCQFLDLSPRLSNTDSESPSSPKTPGSALHPQHSASRLGDSQATLPPPISPPPEAIVGPAPGDAAVDV
eukprot:TRINITY_DN2730_c0_g1_i1.p1 TRINITY_DN2730_c0_g1~~TRINITY_DN2730_c0_g1_i1.p1  ORF type:complete len:430 (+),score=65.06 TRINITY_DN2730_c0_g1_i1:94-1383(+)